MSCLFLNTHTGIRSWILCSEVERSSERSFSDGHRSRSQSHAPPDESTGVRRANGLPESGRLFTLHDYRKCPRFIKKPRSLRILYPILRPNVYNCPRSYHLRQAAGLMCKKKDPRGVETSGVFLGLVNIPPRQLFPIPPAPLRAVALPVAFIVLILLSIAGLNILIADGTPAASCSEEIGR